MAKRHVRKKRRKNRGGKAIWVIFLVLCMLLAVEMVWICYLGDVEVRDVPEYEGTSAWSDEAEWAATKAPTATPDSQPTKIPAMPSKRRPTPRITVRPTEAPVQLQKPTTQPAAEPERTNEPLIGMYPEAVEGFLPICEGKRTGKKVVALTIDDCNQAENLLEIVEIISDYGGKATIFPIGENVSYLSGTLKKASAKGFEIENHTQSHAGLYAESDEELAYQIWQQNRSVSEALGVEYQMHFLRPRGGDNKYDQRTHAYMRQMGYYAMAYWSQVGSNNTAEAVMRDLKQGDIILFHTTDQDVETIRALVPRLKAAGYRMVTLNEMFGLPENERSELAAHAELMRLEPYDRFDQTIREGEYLHDVLRMQARLTELGYLDVSYNGYFGAQTKKALKAFQEDAGLTADGLCGPDTWNALFEE